MKFCKKVNLADFIFLILFERLEMSRAVIKTLIVHNASSYNIHYLVI